MYKNQYALVLALVAGASFSVGTGMGEIFPAWRAHAQQEIRRGEAQEWEYCTIVPQGSVGKSGGRIAYIALVEYHKGTGTQREGVEGSNQSDATSKAIAKLGEEKWEMVNAGAGYNFKRPK